MCVVLEADRAATLHAERTNSEQLAPRDEADSQAFEAWQTWARIWDERVVTNLDFAASQRGLAGRGQRKGATAGVSQLMRCLDVAQLSTGEDGKGPSGSTLSSEQALTNSGANRLGHRTLGTQARRRAVHIPCGQLRKG